MLKILQASLQQYMNHELPDVQAGFRKGRGTRDQIANIFWIIKKARELQKNMSFCFSDHAKAFECVQFSSIHLLSCVWLFVTPWIAAGQASLSITNNRSSPKLMSIESVMPSSHLILCHPLLLLPQSLPASESFPMSQLFKWGGQSIIFSFSVSPSIVHPGLISFRMDWLELLAIEGTLKSLL